MKFLFGSVTDSDIARLSKRIGVLEQYIGDGDVQSIFHLTKLLAAEKILFQRIDGVLNDMKETSTRLSQRFETRMNELSNELEWLHLYLSKITLFIKQSTVITNGLQRLLDSI